MDPKSKKLPPTNPHVGFMHHGPSSFVYPPVFFPLFLRGNNSPHLPSILHAPPQNMVLFSDILRHSMSLRPQEEEEDWVMVEDEDSR